jgi:hypothetical protein
MCESVYVSVCICLCESEYGMWVSEWVCIWVTECTSVTVRMCVCVSVSVCKRVCMCECENDCMCTCVSVCAPASSHPVITVLILFPNSSAIFPSHLKVHLARRQYWLDALDCHGVLAWEGSKSPNVRACQHDCLLSTSPSLYPSSRIPFIATEGTCGVWRQAVLWFCTPACVCSLTLLCHSLSWCVTSVIVFVPLRFATFDCCFFFLKKSHISNIWSSRFFHSSPSQFCHFRRFLAKSTSAVRGFKILPSTSASAESCTSERPLVRSSCIAGQNWITRDSNHSLSVSVI